MKRGRRRGRDRRRLPAARPRHVDPPRRPRVVQPVPGRRPARRPARRASTRSPSGRSWRPRSCTRSSATARGGRPLTLEAGIVRVADALDMEHGRSRVSLETHLPNIHSLSAAAIDEVRIVPGEQRTIRVEVEMNNSAGVFQVDELLATQAARLGPRGPHRGRRPDRRRAREAAADRLPDLSRYVAARLGCRASMRRAAATIVGSLCWRCPSPPPRPGRRRPTPTPPTADPAPAPAPGAMAIKLERMHRVGHDDVVLRGDRVRVRGVVRAVRRRADRRRAPLPRALQARREGRGGQAGPRRRRTAASSSR